MEKVNLMPQIVKIGWPASETENQIMPKESSIIQQFEDTIM